MQERQQVFNFYYNQGYLGRCLIYLVDQLINASQLSFEQISVLIEKDRVKRLEESVFEPSILIHDPYLIIKA
jgi:hypothetical protein